MEKQDKQKDYKVVVQYENQEGEIIELYSTPTTHRKALKEAIRLNRMGSNAKVEHVSSQRLLPYGE